MFPWFSLLDTKQFLSSLNCSDDGTPSKKKHKDERISWRNFRGRRFTYYFACSSSLKLEVKPMIVILLRFCFAHGLPWLSIFFESKISVWKTVAIRIFHVRNEKALHGQVLRRKNLSHCAVVSTKQKKIVICCFFRKRWRW